MNLQTSRNPSYGVGHGHDRQARSMVRSSFCVLPHSPRPARTTSFIFGRSDSRIRPLLNQEERDRLHCWAMLIALASSTVGTTLLLTSMLH